MGEDRQGGQPVLFALAVTIHVLAYVALSHLEAPDLVEPLRPMEVELVELPAPEPEVPPPELEPEPEVAPEPEPPAPPPEPERKPQPKPKTKPPPPAPAPAEEPTPPAPEAAPSPAPPRFELPPDAVIPPSGAGGVAVNTGIGSSRGGSSRGQPNGTPEGKPRGRGANAGSGAGTGPGWQPKSDLFVDRGPRVLRVPEVECPAVIDQQVAGTVVLLVQVQRDGKVRNVRVAEKMGYGCDAIARKALLRSKFTPALGTDGRPVDYELRYEYVFELRQ